MSSRHMIGDLVLRKPVHPWSAPAMVIGASRANLDPLNRESNVYPWVYYVLHASGGIEGPLYFDEFYNVATTAAG